ncbi:EsV-1-15 [Ectocarpus siliculosus]|uniref:EsV-1-15 n=1 Tax=Ectocarpus siliculosus TaxID=2880 RepID=D8LP54_ECTSI|nr:EsV-1-15 [Ectocarpus siliculosus]|eukprot:CBN80325.1 EsV-1-15 [Ectocarpus siliculosus]
MSRNMIRLVIEAVVVGVVMILAGYPCGLLASKLLPMKGGDHRPVMYLSLFLTGLSSHLLFEALKINLWYCSNGFSCST